MTNDIKRMDIKEFREKGFLHEVNRQVLHPVGLAMEIIIDGETGEECLGGVWDYREDPEGIFYGNATINESKMDYVTDLKNSKRVARFLYARENDFVLNKDSFQLPKGD
jgi:hypothetical protein